MPTRRRMFAHVAGLTAAACVCARSPERAFACDSASCIQGWFMPSDGAVLPANVPALAWRVPRDFAMPPSGLGAGPPPKLRMSRIDGTSLEPIDFTLESGSAGLTWIVLSSALVPHARYRLEVEAGCATPAVEFEAAEAAPLPEMLGKLVVTPPRADEVQVTSTSGSCSTPVPVEISGVDVDLDEQAAPWSALFVYETKVDGETWTPTLTPGREFTNDAANPASKVFVGCPHRSLASAQPIDPGAQLGGLAEGTHSIAIEARLPALDRVLRTGQKSVELSCASGSQPASDGCNAALSTAAGPHDAGTRASWMLVVLAALCCMARRRRS